MARKCRDGISFVNFWKFVDGVIGYLGSRKEIDHI